MHAWNQDFVARSPAGQRYERLAGEIDRALAFMRACGADPDELRSVELYSSHEALVLDYEQALTRIDSADRTAATARQAISCGSASGPGRSTARTSSSPAASATRSGSSSARAPIRPMSSRSSPG